MSPEVPPGRTLDTAPVTDPSEENGLARALERRLALPVLVCASASVPAVFLDMWGQGRWAEFGHRVNWLAGLVLWAEWILLVALARNRLDWLRTHRWSTFVAALTLPAVVFALGPAQVLRLVRAAATLRLLRVTRIAEAGGVLRRRLGLTGTRATVVAAATTVLCAVFVAAVLSDPDSASRRYADALLSGLGPWPVVTAAAVVTASLAFVLVRRRRAARTAGPRGSRGRDGSGQSSP
ncbi:metal-sensitive transcriptional repressor family protein [Nocardiopsis sp. NPDC007018]|uniref:metal-sensitive transcriptional repressor family protein n=1 Tax=Nocardiopsis sp. NPDC007018 TaxID=3155721 RepID=UPI0033E3B992